MCDLTAVAIPAAITVLVQYSSLRQIVVNAFTCSELLQHERYWLCSCYVLRPTGNSKLQVETVSNGRTTAFLAKLERQHGRIAR
jgi:hypothetical protein